MTNETENSEAPQGWFANALRLTAFPLNPFKRDQENWWEEVTGGPADSQLMKPHEGLWREAGPYENGILVLEAIPVRIDWKVGPSPSGALNVEETVLPAIGEVERELQSFSAPMRTWLMSSCPPILRLALGLTLIFPVPDRLAGYRMLGDKLHALKVDPENSSDLIYQINRPRISTSGIPDLRINRLSTWSVLRAQRLFPDPRSSTGLPTRGMSGEPRSACRLELDVNTDPSRSDALPRESLGDLLDELVALAKDIAANGDIP